MRIHRLILHTSRLDDTRHFYTEVLGLPLLASSPQGFEVQAGASVLCFAGSKQDAQYHFAFNIPSFSILAARDWLLERVPLLPFEGKEVVEFENWNAQAVYFRDPSGNIVEFIARRNLNLPSPALFGPEAVLCISEAGLPVLDPEQGIELLLAAGLPSYWGKGERFRALGGEEGLFILVAHDWTWMPDETPVLLAPILVEFEEGGQRMELLAEEGRFRIERRKGH